MKRRIVGTLAAVGLAASGLAAAGVAAAAPQPVSVDTISWSACPPADQVTTASCGFVSVPLDYSQPNGTKIQIAVSIVRHKTKKSQGVVLVNPGGPGGSGRYLNTFFTATRSNGKRVIPKNAADSYDWIGFDPRGVGESLPSLSCDNNFFNEPRPNYIPTTPALTAFWLNKSMQYDTACANSAGKALLPHLKTIDAVRDMDQIRAALGASQINYYGFSYGTYLGQVYSTLYPQRVRRMILDSNVDPRRVWYAANLDQDIAFDKNIKIWFQWVAAHNSVFKLGKTEKAVQNLWYAERHKLAANPAGGSVGPDEWTDIFLQAGYYVYGWNDMAKAFSNWIHNPGAATALVLKNLYESAEGVGNDNGFAIYNGVQCTDVQWPLSWAKWSKDNWAVYKKAPFETWDNAWYNAPCLHWPAPAGSPVQVNGKKVPGILLIDETNDAATPFTGSLYTRAIYPRSSLIEGVGGTTHAGSLSGVACVDNRVADYLLTGALPARQVGNRSDLKCGAVPPPSATLAAAAARSTGADTRPAVLTTTHP